VEKPLEVYPFRLDLSAWPILDLLSEVTGYPRYHDVVTEMADAFAHHGFHDRSGLGYLGEEATLDIVRVRPTSSKGKPDPLFKPGNSGNCPGLPLSRLWAHAPEQMARMFKSAHYGLVTNPTTMDYNRFCRYDFDGTAKQHAMESSSAHCAFSSAGARLIHWWGSHFAHTGDHETLAWAQKMADKWRDVQHPTSGLIPYFFGSRPGLGTAMPPCEFTGVRDSSITSVALLQAAHEFRQRPQGQRLAEQLTDMASRLSRGLARNAYDRERRVFVEFLNLDGSFRKETSRYAFRTQREKDEAVKQDPTLREVPVFTGIGLYESGAFWSHCAGSDVPYHMAWCAQCTGDSELISRASELMEMAVTEAKTATSAFTSEGKWTFAATGQYVKALILLFETTQDDRFLMWARQLADREIEHLSRLTHPHWWRVPQRNVLLEGLLRLCWFLQSGRHAPRDGYNQETL